MRFLCELNELAKHTNIPRNNKLLSLVIDDYIIVSSADKLHVYKDRCPHRLKPMSFTSGQLLDDRLNFIRCEHHQALFTISEGLCISGPCVGSKLEEVDFKVLDKKLFILNEGV